MKTLTASDRKNLIRLASTLPKGSPQRRAILAGLKRLAEEEGGGKGSGGGPGKALMKFLEEVGDQKAKNPDTGNEVKVKTLSSAPKDSKAYKLFQDQFTKWKEQQEKGGDKDKGGKPDQKAMDDARTNVDDTMGRGQGARFQKNMPKEFEQFAAALSKGGKGVGDALALMGQMDEKKQKTFIKALKKKSPIDAAEEALGKDSPEFQYETGEIKDLKKIDSDSLSTANRLLNKFFESIN